jgi:hypothetical protein
MADDNTAIPVDMASVAEIPRAVHLTRNLALARKAYDKGDLEESRLAHQALAADHASIAVCGLNCIMMRQICATGH